MAIEWAYNELKRVFSILTERCDIPSKCGRYRISIFAELPDIPTLFYAEVFIHRTWDIIAIRNRLEKAMQACDEYAEGKKVVKEEKKTRRRSRIKPPKRSRK